MWWGKVGTWGLHCFIFLCPLTLASIIVIIQIVSTNLLETSTNFYYEFKTIIRIIVIIQIVSTNLLTATTNF